MRNDRGILIKNIYYMLSYAFTNLRQEEEQKIAGEEFEYVQDLFAAILAWGIGIRRKQGLYREYLNCTEDLATLRGRLDLPGTIRQQLARKRRLSCEFDEFSEDNLLNRILKTTALLLLRSDEVKQKQKDALKNEMRFFSHVERIEPKSIRWSTIRFQRNNRAYYQIINFCRFVLEGLLLSTDFGKYKLASFLDEQGMCRLYEKFILAYYQREHKEVKAEAAQIRWALDDGVNAMLPIMKSDVTLSKGNKELIIDAKYYKHTTQAQYNTATLHSHNLYQIFTYVKNKTAEFRDAPHTVSGMLLYAATTEKIQPDARYRMSGNKISVRTLDLNREFSEIRKQLDCIVTEHFGTA